ncbi:hypothetical protein AAH104_14815, partial [Bacteroides fragilis]
MKKIILLIVSVWMCVSCGNLEEMNIDPDNATQTHPKLLLTQICMNAFKRGTDGMYATKKVIQADGESQFIEVVGAEELSECRIHRSIYTF